MAYECINSQQTWLLKKKWVKFVQRHRKDFSNPVSKYVSLCSAHFEESCYERRYSAIAGNEMKAVLKKGSIPTRDSGVVPQAPEVMTERQKRKVCTM
jgi:fructose-1,6-bisphosphatase